MKLVGFQCFLYIGRHIPNIKIIGILRVKKVVGIGYQPVLCDELHNHILRRTHQIIGIAHIQLIVQILVCAKAGVLYAHRFAVSLPIPVLKFFIQRLLSINHRAVVKLDRFVFVPLAKINVLLPTAHAQYNWFLLRGYRLSQ